MPLPNIPEYDAGDLSTAIQYQIVRTLSETDWLSMQNVIEALPGFDTAQIKHVLNSLTPPANTSRDNDRGAVLVAGLIRSEGVKNSKVYQRTPAGTWWLEQVAHAHGQKAPVS